MVYLKTDCYAVSIFLSFISFFPMINSFFKTQLLLQVVYRMINDSLLN